MVMSKKKKKTSREWSTPLEESKRATAQFAQGLVMSLSILKLIRQLEELEAQGVTIDETYRENLILSLASDVPVGQA
jgi:hypothetical protein